MNVTSKITPCLWFDHQAEEAAKFYVSIFKGSKSVQTTHYGEVGQEIHGRAHGSVMVVQFELAGQTFTALNGGPVFKFNEAISLQVSCESQAEIDEFWSKLSAGGDPKAQQCGWLKDKYGLSWQIVPAKMGEWFAGNDQKKADRAMAAMLGMKKIDFAALQKAFDG